VTPPPNVAPRVRAVPTRAAPTQKGRRTQARLLEGGREVLETRGYFDATVGEIAERGGVALGTFYRYFDNKDELFLDLLETLVDELYESVSGSWGDQDPLSNLRTSSMRYLKAYYDNRLLIAAMMQMRGAVPACAALWWDLRTRTYARMEAYLVQAPTADQLDAGLTSVALGSMVEQFAYHWYVDAAANGKRVPSVERAAETVSRIWYRVIYEEHP
jgi:AcrR family transcriptional regulator